MAEVTVVFADLTGSTGVFESLGNARATQAITRLTQWIGEVCTESGGRVVKYLGDGVLLIFPSNTQAVEAVTHLQATHHERIAAWPDSRKMRLQVGMARGDVVVQGGDCFGDAVNVASRLSDLCGAEQILATAEVVSNLALDSAVRYRRLGPMTIRGRLEPCVVYQIEWQNDLQTENLTVPATLAQMASVHAVVSAQAIGLVCLDARGIFRAADMPVFLGRDAAAHFVVQDLRVSRRHAKLEWRDGKFYLQDVSSYGTWVRFTETRGVIALRRQECVLPLDGELALGASFDDPTVPQVRFTLLPQAYVW